MRTVVVSLQTIAVAALALVLFLAGCTTARRTSGAVVDHPVGVMGHAPEVISGAAEEREKRLGELLGRLNQDRESLGAEADLEALVTHLREHVELQDELIAELMVGGDDSRHKCSRRRRVNAREEGRGTPESTGEISSLVWKATTAEEHQRIAAYYRQEEKKSLAQAARHLELAESYRSLAPTIDASEQAEHCEELARSLRETVAGYDALATYHKQAAAKLRQGNR